MAANEIALAVPTAAGADALDSLATVPWERIQHAYGKGTSRREGINPFTNEPLVMIQHGVDAHLRNLVSSDEECREDAVNDGLYSTIWHQGTIYEATAYAVPFLAAIAADANVPTRGSIVYALSLVLRSALESPAKPDSERVLRAFEAAQGWLDVIARIGPDSMRRFIEMISAMARDKPGMTEDLFDAIEEAFAATEQP